MARQLAELLRLQVTKIDALATEAVGTSTSGNISITTSGEMFFAEDPEQTGFKLATKYLFEGTQQDAETKVSEPLFTLAYEVSGFFQTDSVEDNEFHNDHIDDYIVAVYEAAREQMSLVISSMGVRALVLPYSLRRKEIQE